MDTMDQIIDDIERRGWSLRANYEYWARVYLVGVGPCCEAATTMAEGIRAAYAAAVARTEQAE